MNDSSGENTKKSSGIPFPGWFVLGGLALCCIVEVLAATGIGLGVLGLGGWLSIPTVTAAGAVVLCLVLVAFGFLKGRNDHSCSSGETER